MVFTITDGPARTVYAESGKLFDPNEKDHILIPILLTGALMSSPKDTFVIEPDVQEFASAVPEPHRKGEKAYHVKAFRGSKEGMFNSTSCMFY